MKLTILPLLLLFFLSSTMTFAQQTTAIPDTLFEQILIDKGIDSDATVNGQLLTSDAEAVHSLIIQPLDGDIYFGDLLIYDLAGIEAFVNLDTLVINGTRIEELDVSTLVDLRYLDVFRNSLSDLDVSQNKKLTYLDITSVGEILPTNYIGSIDLTQNPNLDTLMAFGVNAINLNTGSNDATMYISIGVPPPGLWNICIKVDDPQVAQNNAYPYSEWVINSSASTYSFTDDLVACSLGVPAIEASRIKLYPNPVGKRFYVQNLPSAMQIELFSLTGQRVQVAEVSPQQRFVEVNDLASGLYVYKLTQDEEIVKTGKLIKK